MTTLPTGQIFHYRRRESRVDRTGWTWLAIVGNGLSLAFKHAKTRTLLLTAGIPALFASAMLYVISLLEALAGTDEARSMTDFLRQFLQIDLSGVSRIAEFREILWHSTFLLVAKFQMFWVMIVVARTGTGLIANDLKAKALPIYFAKPITPWTYLLGKGCVAAIFVALVTVIPALLALIIGVALTGGLDTWPQTIRLALDVLAGGVMVCVAAASVSLVLSSLTADQRYVTVAWVAVCLLPTVAQQILNDSLPAETAHGWLGCVSLRDDLVIVIEHLLGIRRGLAESGLAPEKFARALGHSADPVKAATVLAAVIVGAGLMSWRRVVRFSRSAAST